MQGQSNLGKQKRTESYSLSFKQKVIVEVKKGGSNLQKMPNAGIGFKGRVLFGAGKYIVWPGKSYYPMKGKQTPEQQICKLQRQLKHVEK